MARSYKGKNWGNQPPEVGPAPANVGGKHGGISPASQQMSADGIHAEGSTGNPGTEFAWEGVDSTAIGAKTALPPLTHLGDALGGHDQPRGEGTKR